MFQLSCAKKIWWTTKPNVLEKSAGYCRKEWDTAVYKWGSGQKLAQTHTHTQHSGGLWDAAGFCLPLPHHSFGAAPSLPLHWQKQKPWQTHRSRSLHCHIWRNRLLEWRKSLQRQEKRIFTSYFPLQVVRTRTQDTMNTTEAKEMNNTDDGPKKELFFWESYILGSGQDKLLEIHCSHLIGSWNCCKYFIHSCAK